MHIAHFRSEFSPLSETFIYDTITELESLGVKNHVITQLRLNEQDRPVENVSVLQRPSKWAIESLFNHAKCVLRRFPRKHTTLLSARSRLRGALKEIRPDVIHAHFGNDGALVYPVSSELSIPLVVSFHGFDLFRLSKDDYWMRQYREMFSRASAFTVVSEVMRDYLVGLGAAPSKVHLVHVGKRVQEYEYKARTSPIREWISVGRLMQKKGFDDCIKAFGIATEGTDAVLRIIGEGPQEQELKSLVQELGLEHRVLFLGSLSHDKVKSALAGADAFILCSKTSRTGDREGIPTVLMEAQFMGLPCVATRHSGIPEVIPAESQKLLADEGDVGGLAACIRELMQCDNDELKQIGIRGRELVEKSFDLATETNTLKEIYKSLSDGRTTTAVADS
ncbi:MAG TPA: glycosyltransferase [Abditibacteriaceae bacterium]